MPKKLNRKELSEITRKGKAAPPPRNPLAAARVKGTQRTKVLADKRRKKRMDNLLSLDEIS